MPNFKNDMKNYLVVLRKPKKKEESHEEQQKKMFEEAYGKWGMSNKGNKTSKEIPGLKVGSGAKGKEFRALSSTGVEIVDYISNFLKVRRATGGNDPEKIVLGKTAFEALNAYHVKITGGKMEEEEELNWGGIPVKIVDDWSQDVKSNVRFNLPTYVVAPVSIPRAPHRRTVAGRVRHG